MTPDLTHCDPNFRPRLKRVGSRYLEEHDQPIYGMRPDGEIAYVNPAYLRFADEHGAGEEIRESWGVGANAYDAMVGPLKQFYRERFTECARRGVVWDHLYECSNSTTFREFNLRAFPLDGAGLLVVHALVVQSPHDPETHPAHRPELGRYMDEHGLVVQCYHCRRVRRPGASPRWDWVPQWVDHPPPNTSGTLCTPCAAHSFPGVDVTAIC